MCVVDGEKIKCHQVDMYAFALLWYILLAGVAYGTFEGYFVMWDHEWFVNNAVVHVVISCGIYLVCELLYYTSSWIEVDNVKCDRTTESTHCIIAAHKAFASLVDTIPHALQSFPADRIWVADNGYKDVDTQRLCEELGVHYRYLDIGNKTKALLVVAQEIEKTYGDSVRNVCLLDDDTHLAPDFFIRHDLLAKPLVAGYCVGIGISKAPPFNLWEYMIDFEYRSISYRNGTRGVNSTISFVHGICAVYRLRRMIMIYSKLCTLPHGLPFGEDAFAGIDCRMAGYKMSQDNHNLVLTYCPRKLATCCGVGRQQGFGASSIWKQRVHRWYLSWIRRLPAEVALGLMYDTGTWWGNVRYRLELLYYIFIMSVSTGWFLFVLYLWYIGGSWVMLGSLHGFLFGTSTLCCFIRYCGFNSLLRSHVQPWVVLAFPFMNMCVCFMMFWSFILAMTWYIPFKRIDYDKTFVDAE